MAELINGKVISAAVKERIAKEVEELKQKGLTPGLAVIIVGSDPASQVYVGSKGDLDAAPVEKDGGVFLPIKSFTEKILSKYAYEDIRGFVFIKFHRNFFG